MEVLSRKKFALKKETRDIILGALDRYGIITEPVKYEKDMVDEKDRMFIEAAIGSRKERETYIITGNLKHFEGEEMVLNPRGMIDLLEACEKSQ